MIGKRLKDLRIEKKLSQVEIAELFGVKQTTYSNYELNNREPEYEMLIKMSEFFEVSVDYLLGLTDQRGKTELSEESSVYVIDGEELSKDEIKAVIEMVRKLKRLYGDNK